MHLPHLANHARVAYPPSSRPRRSTPIHLPFQKKSGPVRCLKVLPLIGLAAPRLMILSQVISHDIVPRIPHYRARRTGYRAKTSRRPPRASGGRLQLVLMMSTIFPSERLLRHTARRAAARRRGREDGGRVRLPGLLRVPTVLHVSSPRIPPILFRPSTRPHRVGTSTTKSAPTPIP